MLRKHVLIDREMELTLMVRNPSVSASFALQRRSGSMLTHALFPELSLELRSCPQRENVVDQNIESPLLCLDLLEKTLHLKIVQNMEMMNRVR